MIDSYPTWNQLVPLVLSATDKVLDLRMCALTAPYWATSASVPSWR